ncbi:MAG: lysoplasmalogenase, partial [Comamonas sp.]
GRYQVQQDRSALLVALGASAFMVSDSILAINRFVQPLPWAAIWVLTSYYVAQALIVQGSLRWQARPHTATDFPAQSEILSATEPT